MPCLIGCLAAIAPRVLLVLLFLLTPYLHHAYDTVLWPVLGTIFLPYTTLAYAWAMNAHGSLEGIWIGVLILAVIFDVGSSGGNAPRGRRD